MQVLIKKIFSLVFNKRFWDKVFFGKKEVTPCVIWFTGLSGAGKSTIAEALYARLREKRLKAEHLDGDSVRDIFPQTGFSKADRDEHVKRIGYLASRLEKHGVIVLVSFISPYREARAFVRRLCKNFFEVYVSTSLEECERRDVKGLYRKVRKGEITQFTGIDDPYEVPDNPELVIHTEGRSVDECVDQITQYFKRVL